MQIDPFEAAEIRELITEVSKERPNYERIKALVKKYNIEFSEDPIEQLTLVLQKIDLRGFGKFGKTFNLSEQE